MSPAGRHSEGKVKMNNYKSTNAAYGMSGPFKAERDKKMKSVKIKGQKFFQYENGILVPADLVRESRLTKVCSPKDLLPHLESEKFAKQEHVIVFTLDGYNQIIKKHVVTIGLANQSLIHPREIFFPAIQDQAVSIVMAHNHPSGNIEPSDSDLVSTKRMVEASKIMGITILDHVIFGQTGFLSLRERFPLYFL